MTSARFASGNVVDPVGAADLERYVLQLFCKGEVAAAVEKFWEVDNDGFVHDYLYDMVWGGECGSVEGLEVEGGDGYGGAAEDVEADYEAGGG